MSSRDGLPHNAVPDAPSEEALAQLAGGDAMGAFQTLRPALATLAEGDVGVLKIRLSAFADIAHAIAGDPLAEVLTSVARNPDDAKLLHDAGYALYEHQLFDIAAALLLRANQIAPGQPFIVTEAVACLEALMRYTEAKRLLEGSGLTETNPLCRYLSGFCALMSGDLALARARLQGLAGIDEEPIPEVREALAGMVARAEAIDSVCPLDDRALTGWHMAINGTLLLHESPHGHDEPMRGRYAFVADGPALMREGIERLISSLVTMPEQVVHAPDRSSRILSKAIAERLGRPVGPWKKGAKMRDTLVVVWSLEAVEDPEFLEAMSEHAPGQVLFVHASSWVEPFAYAPDVTTYLHEAATNPWLGGALVRAPSGEGFEEAAPDLRADDVLVREILAISPRPDESASTMPQVLRVRDAVRPLPETRTAGMFRAAGARRLQRGGSSVPSARFGR